MFKVSAWKHVPGKENPADDLSRGMSAKDLAETTRWWEGPEFIKQNEESWPKQPLKYDNSVREVINEKIMGVLLKRPQINNVNEQENNDNVLLILNPAESRIIERFSKWQRYIKIRCWIQRWKNKVLFTNKNKTKKKGKIKIKSYILLQKRNMKKWS